MLLALSCIIMLIYCKVLLAVEAVVTCCGSHRCSASSLLVGSATAMKSFGICTELNAMAAGCRHSTVADSRLKDGQHHMLLLNFQPTSQLSWCWSTFNLHFVIDKPYHACAAASAAQRDQAMILQSAAGLPFCGLMPIFHFA